MIFSPLQSSSFIEIIQAKHEKHIKQTNENTKRTKQTKMKENIHKKTRKNRKKKTKINSKTKQYETEIFQNENYDNFFREIRLIYSLIFMAKC